MKTLKEREFELTICTLSPCIAIAGKPFKDNQCSNASAPLFVSTNIKVKACCAGQKMKWFMISSL